MKERIADENEIDWTFAVRNAIGQITATYPADEAAEILLTYKRRVAHLQGDIAVAKRDGQLYPHIEDVQNPFHTNATHRQTGQATSVTLPTFIRSSTLEQKELFIPKAQERIHALRTELLWVGRPKKGGI